MKNKIISRVICNVPNELKFIWMLVVTVFLPVFLQLHKSCNLRRIELNTKNEINEQIRTQNLDPRTYSSSEF